MGTGAARLGAGAGYAIDTMHTFLIRTCAGWQGHAHDRKRGQDERSKAEKVSKLIHLTWLIFSFLCRPVSDWPASCRPATSAIPTARNFINFAKCPCRGSMPLTEGFAAQLICTLGTKVQAMYPGLPRRCKDVAERIADRSRRQRPVMTPRGARAENGPPAHWPGVPGGGSPGRASTAPPMLKPARVASIVLMVSRASPAAASVAASLSFSSCRAWLAIA